LPQFTVNVNVAVCCSVPEVPVTVTVEVTGCVPPPPPPPPDPPLPHPLNKPSPPKPTITTSINNRRRFLNPKQQTATAIAAPGNRAPEPRRTSAVDEDVATVSVVEVVPGGVTVAGEKLHVAPAGSPEQLNETAALNPLAGVTVTVVVPLPPADTLIEPGEAATEKLAGRLMVYVALATALSVYPGASAIALIVSVDETVTVNDSVQLFELVVGVVPSVV